MSHAAAPHVSADERARLNYAVALKKLLRAPALRQSFAKAANMPHAAGPDQWRTAHDALRKTEGFNWWSAALRAQQEYYVNETAQICAAQSDDLANRAAALGAKARGSLRLDPTVSIPSYQSTVDIHCVPGSYFLERFEGDVWAGARCDLGSVAFAMGNHGALNDDKGLVGAAFLKERFPDLEPAKILDLGCTIGMSTLPYCDAFPQADVYAIDVSAPCLRYGHARAQALDKTVYFQQANAEKTPFEDSSIDVVVSHILMHETSAKALPAILKEAHRVLRPGGVMLHIEVPVKKETAFEQAMANWDSLYNNEPFWACLSQTDLQTMAVGAGFDKAGVFEEIVQTKRNKQGGWLAFGARKGAA